MNRSITFIKKPIVWIPILVILILIFWRFTAESEVDIDFEKAIERNVTEEISGTARVEAEKEITLSFEIPGVIESVLVKEGDVVKAGEPMARLNTEIKSSEVERARAGLKAERARLDEMLFGLTDEDADVAESKMEAARVAFENAEERLSDIKETERIKVKNARESLLTNDLHAKLSGNERDTAYSYEPPVISGVYKGSEEGEYGINLYRSQADSGYSFSYETDIEDDGFGRVSTITPQPLGDLGLKILFPENFARNRDVEWVVEIPNRDSSTYTQLRQAYETALENEEKAVRDAERTLEEAKLSYELAKSEFESATAGTRSEKVVAQEAAVDRARATLQAALTNLNKSVLRSPIDGVVYIKHLSVGEAVSPGLPVFSISSEDLLHLTIRVSEVDIANLSVDDVATVRFDAFPREEFEAKVVYVSNVAIERDGVASFKTVLEFVDIDNRIRSGMTADVDIKTDRRENVVAVPGRSLIQKDGVSHVRMMEDGYLIYRPVERGLRGSDGWVEIVSGLKEGEEIIVYADESDLKRLEER